VASLPANGCDVAIVGAGPYGLAAAAHLRAVKGLDVRVFGERMAFWDRQMPVGMLLRSPWEASHISDPRGELTLDRYEQITGPVGKPVPLARFVDYGSWFQEQVVPDLDTRRVERIASNANGFHVVLDDGEDVRARRVVVAAGIGAFAARPREFDDVPQELASHAADHRDLTRFAGQEVVVVGGGQSALESAALLHEGGASVEVLVRAPQVHWLVRSSRLHRLRALRRLLYAPADIGPAGLSWVVATPACFKSLPLDLQGRVARRSIRPAGSGWLVARLRDVPIRIGNGISSATPRGDRLELRLDDGSTRLVDHVLLGTGYRVDVSKFDFLAPELVSSLRVVDGYPCLDRGMQSSVPGLHFAGAPAAWSFGPLMRFVAGTGFAARALTRGIARRASRA
jgi:cation diffusion facilitator CzcD-associated flavoprotein CzcO